MKKFKILSLVLALVLAIGAFLIETGVVQVAKVLGGKLAKNDTVEILGKSGKGTEIVDEEVVDSMRNEGYKAIKKHGISKDISLQEMVKRMDDIKAALKDQFEKDKSNVELLKKAQIDEEDYIDCIAEKFVAKLVEMEKKSIPSKKGDGISMMRQYRIECIQELSSTKK